MPRTLQFKGPNTGFLNTPNLTQGFRVQASLDGGSSRVVIKSRGRLDGDSGHRLYFACSKQKVLSHRQFTNKHTASRMILNCQGPVSKTTEKFCVSRKPT